MNDEIFFDAIQEKTTALKEAILQSEEYTKFIMAKREVEKDAASYEQINRFRAKNFELQISGKSVNPELVTNLMKEYGELLADTKVSAYMNAELMLCRRLHKMNEDLMEEIDLDLEFL